MGASTGRAFAARVRVEGWNSSFTVCSSKGRALGSGPRLWSSEGSCRRTRAAFTPGGWGPWTRSAFILSGARFLRWFGTFLLHHPLSGANGNGYRLETREFTKEDHQPGWIGNDQPYRGGVPAPVACYYSAVTIHHRLRRQNTRKGTCPDDAVDSRVGGHFAVRSRRGSTRERKCS